MKKTLKKNSFQKFTKLDLVLLFFLLVVGVIFRLYKINTPLADHHSWRQADTAAVARNFLKEGFNLLIPKFDDLSNIPSGKYNPEGFRMVEFPLYNALFAFLYQNFPFFPLEVYGRLVSIVFSLIILIVIYLLTLKEEGRLASFFSCLIYAIMPFFVFYSRVILPETMATSLSFLSIFFLYSYSLSSNFLFFLFSLIFFAAAVLVKPTTIFFGIPLFYLFVKKYGFEVIKKKEVYLFFILSLLPFLLWRIWITKFAEGIPRFEWLITSITTNEGVKRIFFKPAFFRWIFQERISSLILGNYLLVFVVLGLVKKPKKSGLFLSLAFSSLLYLLIFQGGNVQHDYYQTLILPSLAIFVGLGINFFLSSSKMFLSFWLNLIITIAIIIISFLYSFYQVRDFYNYPQELITAARLIQTFTKEDDKIVTDRMGDTTLLYLSNRKGFPAITEPVEELKKHSLKYLVTFDRNLAQELKNKLETVFESDRFFIFKL